MSEEVEEVEEVEEQDDGTELIEMESAVADLVVNGPKDPQALTRREISGFVLVDEDGAVPYSSVLGFVTYLEGANWLSEKLDLGLTEAELLVGEARSPECGHGVTAYPVFVLLNPETGIVEGLPLGVPAVYAESSVAEQDASASEYELVCSGAVLVVYG